MQESPEELDKILQHGQQDTSTDTSCNGRKTLHSLCGFLLSSLSWHPKSRALFLCSNG